MAFLIHRTDFIVEYGKILKLQKFLKYYDYEEWKAKNFNEPRHWLINYPVFIRETVKGGDIVNFLVHLFGCPICSITALSLAASLFYNPFAFLFIAGFRVML